MPAWSPERISKKANEDFESAWLETAGLIKQEGRLFHPREGKGTPHPIEVARDKIRAVLLDLGFDEVITPLIWEDEHVKRQYGPESALILDRCYYLAGLPRPEIGLSKEKLDQIGRIVPDFTAVDKLTELLREYKAGKIESDDFVEEMVKRLSIHEEKATEIVDKVFAEMKKLQPIPTNLTVLSHFTTAWFPILAEVLRKKVTPVLLFTTGVRMRREQREDATHLRSHYNASIVIMDSEFSLEDGRSMARTIIQALGFSDVTFVRKQATSKYYTPGSEEEVFAVHPSVTSKKGSPGIEIADLGMYSPVALSRYGIPHPVFNMGLSIGRLAMITEGAKDIRDLTYPEIYSKPRFSDEEMERSLKPMSSPTSKEGKAISDAIVRVATKEADTVAPCAFTAWEGHLAGLKVKVGLVEVEKDVKLTGPAAFNVVRVENGTIIASPPRAQEERPGRLSYIRCMADFCASQIEREAAQATPGTREIRVGMVRSASDVYLEIPIAVRRFIESKNKKIDIRGPMFTTVRYSIVQA